MFKQTGTLLPLSEQNLVDCSGDYHNNGCDGGLAMRCFSYISDHGIMSERKYPYTAEVQYNMLPLGLQNFGNFPPNSQVFQKSQLEGSWNQEGVMP